MNPHWASQHPAHHTPIPTAPRPIVALIYKNFAAHHGVSHIGLGVAALNTSKVLRRSGYEAHVWPVVDAHQIRANLQAHPAITHVIISAPWLPMMELGRLVIGHPHVDFAVNCHSNVGFLQADANGIDQFKQLLHAETTTWNLHAAGTSTKFVRWVRDAFEAPCLWLPNLYFLDDSARINPPRWNGGPLKIGAFGATRPLKNLLSAAAAAFELSAQLRADTQFWISSGRTDGGDTMVRAVRKLFEGETMRHLHFAPWTPWPEFRYRYVRSMHLLLQPSYTEGFNMVTADGIAEGVPSVVSEAIDWVPKNWIGHFDDVFDIAQVARHLLHDSHAGHDGLQALKRHNREGLAAWVQYLTGTPAGE